MVEPDEYKEVPLGKSAIYETDPSDEEVTQWSDTLQDTIKSDSVGLGNTSGIPGVFALCSVGGEGCQEDFKPLLRFEHELEEPVVFGQSVMLQAYAVSKCREGQLVDPLVLNNPLFYDSAKRPKPINILREEKMKWWLYSVGGKPKLEKV